MRIYFVRHAIATERGDAKIETRSDERPLTKEGRSRMEKGARGIRKLIEGRKSARIFSSPLTRAKETAAILAAELGSERKVEETPALYPDAPPGELFSFLRQLPRTSTIVLVGHEPQLSRAIALMIGSRIEGLVLKKGGAALVDARAPAKAGGLLLWLMTPAQLRKLG